MKFVKGTGWMVRRKGDVSRCRKCGRAIGAVPPKDCVTEHKNYHERLLVWARNRRYIRKYGVTKEIFLKMVDGQEGRCFLCGRKVRLGLDHNHKTKQIRRALCWPCNTFVGWVEKFGLEYLKRIEEYLK